MLLEIEIKREMIRLLLSNSNLNLQRVEEVISCAEELTNFIIEKNPSQEPCHL